MHIKQIIVNGFRSFRNQNEIEPFSSKHNVIVGRNGSGKSNFFDAIQFVLLGPKFASLRQEDRQHLLHEGAGSSVMAAYVEIIFDNSDGRLSIDSDEVVLRRSVGLKKDEFFLNRKRVLKSEVQSLLESAGFSKSNPYYVVQQGKVSNLCVMKDKDRLDLLKEIAGTTVYEERREESLKIIQDTTSKQEQIMEVLSFIEERLSELEKEKEELTEYEQLDKNRRALEYTLYHNELTQASEQLAQIEVTREDERDQQQALYAALCEAQEARQVQEDELAACRVALARLSTRQSENEADLARASSVRATFEVEQQEAEIRARSNEETQARDQEYLREISEQIQQCEVALSEIEPDYFSAGERMTQLREELDGLRARSDALSGKQGRGRQFARKADRDDFLSGQIKLIQTQLKLKREQLAKIRSDITADEGRLEHEREQVSLATNEQRLRTNRYNDLANAIRDTTQQRNAMQELRKTTWRDLESLQEQIADVSQDYERGKQQLSMALPKHISQGLAAVERITEERNIGGYYGPLIDNFVLKNDAFRTAVEVAAGNALFHVVVDTDETAAILMKELERRKAGRLTFLPLNRLRNTPTKYPDSNDVRPLIDVALEFDPEVAEAMKQVFGKKLLARDLDVAARFSREFQLDAITRDGDVVNRRGGFEGGYHDERVSRMAAVQRIRDATQQLSELKEREKALRSESTKAEAAVNECLRALQALEVEREHLSRGAEQLIKELGTREKHLAIHSTGIQDRKNGVSALERDIEASETLVETYKQEIKSPLLGKLTEVEASELEGLADREVSVRMALEALVLEHRALTQKREAIRADLKDNLIRRRNDVSSRLALASVGGGGGIAPDNDDTLAGDDGGGASKFRAALDTVIVERDFAIRAENAAKAELREVERLYENKRLELANLERNFEKIRSEEAAAQEELGEAAKKQDKLLNKRSMLMHTVHENQRKIRDIGALPRKEVDEHRNSSVKQLLKRLKDVNEGLKKYASVNKKALEQFVSFNEHRSSLIARRDELVRDSGAIKQLIESLDAQKEEAIMRTFQGVSGHFSDVFSELVPGGSGELVMKTAMHEDGDEDETAKDAAAKEDEAEDNDDEDIVKGKNISGKKAAKESKASKAKAKVSSSSSSSIVPSIPVSLFRGIQVRVTFSGTGRQYDMQQLSGGQKALVALALIFAIQRCDPAPFYLFDEIDQALDSNYRAGVARLIQKQVESVESPAQFITTTFRPELVAVANKCYGIALMNKVSNIYPLDKADAQDFVTNLMNEEEAVGAVSAVPTFSRNRRGRGEGDEDDDDQEEEVESEERVGAGAGRGGEDRSTGGTRRSRGSLQTYQEDEDDDDEQGEDEEDGRDEENEDDIGFDFSSRLIPGTARLGLGFDDGDSLAELDIDDLGFSGGKGKGKSVSKGARRPAAGKRKARGG